MCNKLVKTDELDPTVYEDTIDSLHNTITNLNEKLAIQEETISKLTTRLKSLADLVSYLNWTDY